MRTPCTLPLDPPLISFQFTECCHFNTVTLYTFLFILAWTCPFKTPWFALKLSTWFDFEVIFASWNGFIVVFEERKVEKQLSAPPSCFMRVCLELKIWLSWKLDVMALVLYRWKEFSYKRFHTKTRVDAEGKDILELGCYFRSKVKTTLWLPLCFKLLISINLTLTTLVLILQG